MWNDIGFMVQCGDMCLVSVYLYVPISILILECLFAVQPCGSQCSRFQWYQNNDQNRSCRHRSPLEMSLGEGSVVHQPGQTAASGNCSPWISRLISAQDRRRQDMATEAATVSTLFSGIPKVAFRFYLALDQGCPHFLTEGLHQLFDTVSGPDK